MLSTRVHELQRPRVLFTGLLWMLGLMCGRERHDYGTDLSRHAKETTGVLLHGPTIPMHPARQATRRRDATP
jgi:hypothetical protein